MQRRREIMIGLQLRLCRTRRIRRHRNWYTRYSKRFRQIHRKSTILRMSLNIRRPRIALDIPVRANRKDEIRRRVRGVDGAAFPGAAIRAHGINNHHVVGDGAAGKDGDGDVGRVGGFDFVVGEARGEGYVFASAVGVGHED